MSFSLRKTIGLFALLFLVTAWSSAENEAQLIAPGAEPVKRMLLDEVAEACISAHVLDEEIDAGEVLQEVSHPMPCDQDLPLIDQVEQVKRDLTPYFGPLLIEALDTLVERYEQQYG